MFICILVEPFNSIVSISVEQEKVSYTCLWPLKFMLHVRWDWNTVAIRAVPTVLSNEASNVFVFMSSP